MSTINVWVSGKTQQGAYEKFSNTHMSGNTGKIRTKLFNTTIANNETAIWCKYIMTAELQQ